MTKDRYRNLDAICFLEVEDAMRHQRLLQIKADSGGMKIILFFIAAE